MARRATKLTKEQIEEQEAHRRKVMLTLTELSGEKLAEDQVERKGSRMVLPETMDLREAHEFLGDYIESQESVTQFNRTFRYRPWDGAAALNRALLRVTGTTGVPKRTMSFFGSEPPELRTINIAYNETAQVPWGRLAVPFFEGIMTVGATQSRTWGALFVVAIDAPRKYKAAIEGLFNVIEEELKAQSIYKGAAVDGELEYLDLSGVNPAMVVYSEETTRQLDANIWSVIHHTEALRRHGIPRKRAVLLEGTYGTGKTLAAFLTAQAAVSAPEPWTFLYCRPVKDNLDVVMTTARLYQPAVVFFEDVDLMTQDETSRDGVAQLLDMFDGITAKGTEIMVVLTTNHKERIHRGMIRPGRLDAVVHIGAFDQSAVQKMIESLVPQDLRGLLDYDEIYKAMDGFLPAFVKEAVDRTMRYSIARNNGEVERLETPDFVDAALGLHPQLELMEGAKEGTKPDTMSAAMRREITTALAKVPITDTGGDHVLTLEADGNGVED